MIADAIKAIQKMQDEARAAEVVRLSEVPDQVFVHIGESFTPYDVKPEARRHTLYLLDDLAQWSTGESVSWVSLERVVLVIDDSGLRRDTVTLSLGLHPTFATLVEMEQMAPMPHVLFVNFLRTHLKQEIETAAPGWLKTVRDFKVTQRSDAHSSVGHGQDSFGKSIAAEAMGLKDLDEQLIISTPVWTGYDVRVDVPCEFIVNTIDATFQLVPTAAAIEDAKRAAVEWLAAQVQGVVQGVTCQGRP